MGDFACCFAHVVRGIDAERFGRYQTFRCLVPDHFPDTTAEPLGFEIPIGAINGIACRAGLHGILKLLAGHAARQGIGLGIDISNDTIDRFPVTGIGNAFPIARMGAVRQGHLDHMCLGPGPARDFENLCKGEDFGNHSELRQLKSPEACRRSTQRRCGPGQQPEDRIRLRYRPEAWSRRHRQAPWC